MAECRQYGSVLFASMLFASMPCDIPHIRTLQEIIV